MNDQAFQLRNLKRLTALAAIKREPSIATVSLLGSKGGVGTTTLAAYLALELSRRGRALELSTAGSRAADLAAMTGIDDLNNPLGATVHRWTDQISVRSAPLSDRTSAVPGRDAAPDLILEDVGCWDGTRQALEPLEQNILLITTGDTLAMMDAYACVKKLSELHGPEVADRLCIVVNQATEFASEAIERLKLTCQRFLGLELRQPLTVQLSGELVVPIDVSQSDGLVVESLVEYLDAIVWAKTERVFATAS
jgi:MinD-like ATPase involved in chromosome partitioning or flagellar assembly